MALTGSNLWLYTQGLIDKDYSDFLSTSKANRFFESALYNVIEQKVAVNDSQKIYDELGYLYKTDLYSTHRKIQKQNWGHRAFELYLFPRDLY